MVSRVRSKFLLVLVLCFYVNFAVADHRAIVQRQDGATTSPSTDSTVSKTSSNEPSQTGSRSENNKGSTSTDQAKSTFATLTRISNSTTSSTSATSAVDSTTAVISNLNGAAPTSPFNPSTYNSTLTPDKLPITPEVTPAFGVAGVILMLSGIVYTLVGMKNKFLHISLSAAYLSSLAVTVLILYVMNPPVSDAIQGAYLVAIVITGLILGGAAIVFTEMTEGLGCLLGGFCFSMWLLVLKPGGLLTATSSKSIFIAAFTVAAFSTSFSHYTRPYGLIGGVSFGGATAVVLGIDCFSRAGLKEFWAYLWNLNSNLFPIGATSYPMTRGMKVEIAAIVLIFLAGIVSQVKLWKVIKERREQRASERLQDERTMEQEEENVGRRIEHATAEDRNQWEAIYGNKEGVKPTGPSNRDSGVGDMESKKGPRSEVTSLRQSNDDIEMSDMPSPMLTTSAGLFMTNKGQDSSQVTVNVARDIEPPQTLDENDNPVEQHQNRRGHVSPPNSAQFNPNEEKVWVVRADGEARLERRPSHRNSKPYSAGPDVVPLPFKVPEGDDVGSNRSSVATFADDDIGANKRRSKHLSVGSILMRKLSVRSSRSHRDSKNFTAGEGVSTEDLVIAREVEDDRASSIAATVDGLSDDDDDMRSVRLSGADTTDSVQPEESGAPPSTQFPTNEHQQSMSKRSYNLKSDGDAPRPVSAATVATDILEPEPTNRGTTKDAVDAQDAQRPSIAISDPKSELKSVSEEPLNELEKEKGAPSVVSAAESKPTSITKDRLPPQQSKVVTSYRTNEWAKHLSNADAPEIDELKLAGYAVENEMATEPAAPVNVEELQQTASTTALHVASRAASQTPTHVSPGISKTTPATSSTYQPQDNSLLRSTSQISVNSQNATTRGFRSSSGSLIPQPIVESPIEADFPSHSPTIQTTSKFPSPTPFGAANTLMGKRDTMLRSKSSYSANNSNLASTPEFPSQSQSTSRIGSDAGSVYNYPNTNAIIHDDDNMSLSARREMIRQSSLHQLDRPLQQTPVLYDSHQPKRQSSIPHPMAREQQLASWRASMQQDLKANVVPKSTIERSRSALLTERQQEEQKRMFEERQRSERDSKFDARMRRGDMLDAHREALRRMQASANKYA